MKQTRIRLGAALVVGASALCDTDAFAQGIPVIDVGNIAQTIQAVTQLQAQLAQQIALLNSLTGPRGMGTLLDNPQLHATLPQNWQTSYAGLGAPGTPGMTPAALAIREANQVVDCPTDASVESSICRRQQSLASQNEAYTVGVYQNTQTRLDQIEALMAQIDFTADPKASADLSARLMAELASVQNDTNRVELFTLFAASEAALVAQQRHELDVGRAARSDSTAQGLSAVSFP